MGLVERVRRRALARDRFRLKAEEPGGAALSGSGTPLAVRERRPFELLEPRLQLLVLFIQGGRYDDSFCTGQRFQFFVVGGVILDHTLGQGFHRGIGRLLGREIAELHFGISALPRRHEKRTIGCRKC